MTNMLAPDDAAPGAVTLLEGSTELPHGAQPPPGPPEEPGLVSAVVLTYNKLHYTRLCIEGLCRTAYRPLEIILVDNGSTNSTVELIHEFAQRTAEADVRLTVIRNDANRGAPAARNQAIAAARGQWLLFIDNDAIPFNSQWLGILTTALQRLPDAGAVSARLLYPYPPHLVQFAGCGISKTGRVDYLGRGADRGDPEYRVTREVQCLISACLLMPTDLVREAGAFDEAYHPVQYEDLDLCYRVRERGVRCYMVPDAEVYHFENTTTDGSSDINFRYVTIKNGILFKKRWQSRFGQEEGPDDADVRWKALEQRTLDDMGADWNPWASTSGTRS